MSRRVLMIAVTAAIAVAGVLRAPHAPDATAAAGPATDRLTWSRCRDGMECTSFPVPVRYDDPTGRQLSIAAARVRAGDASRRIGSLLVNPGGPGLSAIDVLTRLAASLPASITDRFDVVAIDPRGVGRSAAVDCGVALDPVFDLSFAPSTPAERDALVAAVQSVADGCAAHDGRYLSEISTLDTARDMDVLRALMGDKQVTYLGYSYGTYLGALYAAVFPSRVRALVLDGPVDPSVDARASTLQQARGFEQSLDTFLAWCDENGDECPFGAGDDPTTAYDALRARIATTPISVDPRATGDKTGAVRVLNDTRFDAAVVQQLYAGRAGWPALAAGLADAARGKAERLLVAADRFFGRLPGGRDDGSVEAFWAISCLDDPTAAAIGDLQARAQEVAPRVGAFVANFSLACSVWPTRALPRTVPALAGVAPGALVVGTRDDPATPFVGAKRLARLLGDASMVVAPGNRHTATGAGNQCVDDAVARYLVSPGTAMPPRRRC